MRIRSSLFPRKAKCLLLIVLGTCLAGCASVSKNVEDPRIECGDKACKQACRIFKKAEAGSAGHQTALAALYSTGADACVPRDVASALAWNRKAAARGDALAMFRIGEAYQHGRGIPVDELEALEWYRRAADAGYDDALGRRIDSSLFRHGPLDAKASYDMLAVKNASLLAKQRTQQIAELGTIVLAGGWRDGKPALGKPRGSASGVTGKLMASAVIGGGLAWAGGGPIGAAMYGILFALAGVKQGIEDGRAGKAIHEELNSTFEDIDFLRMVRGELQERLDETEGPSSPHRVVISGEDMPTAGQFSTRVELHFESAKLDNVLHAWQFDPGNRPGLVLVMKTRAKAGRGDRGKALFEETIEYEGRTLLNGLEKPFRDEVRRAAGYIAGRILLRLAEINDTGVASDELAAPR